MGVVSLVKGLANFNFGALGTATVFGIIIVGSVLIWAKSASGQQRDEIPVLSEPKIPLAPPPKPKMLPLPGTLAETQSTRGYQTRIIEGFTVIFNNEVFQESRQFHNEPLTFIADELKDIARIFPAAMLKPLRTVKIWVEWNDLDLANPDVVAKYYGTVDGHWVLARGKHPGKAACVEVIALKRLHKLKAVDKTPKALVILHELAHAVHFLAVDHNKVQTTYRQAMERNLFRGQYAAKNEFEYFAEISCAYLDRLDYSPRTREELEEYDRAGHRLMELVWGRPDRLKTTAKELRPILSPEAKAREDELTADSELIFAQTFAKAGKMDRAREKAQSIIDRFPRTKAAHEAKKLLMELDK
jgi:hypothetical protein